MLNDLMKQAYWPWVAGAILFLAVVLHTPVTELAYRHTLEKRADTAHPAQGINMPAFTDRTWQAGLFARHIQGGEKLTGLDEALGAGACALDYDNDDDIDLFVVGGSGQSRYYGKREWWQQARGNVLYRNKGHGEFEDVTTTAGFGPPLWGMGCIAGDFDNDGDADLLITNKGGNELYRNNADGTFTNVTAASGLAGDEWSTSATLADYDADGLLDIYIVNYINYDKHQLTYEGGSGFKATLSPRFDANLYDSQPNRLYHNKGSLEFEDVTDSAGVADTSGRGLAASWMDLDNDGYPDLVISNDAGFPNVVYINQRNGRFADQSGQFHLNTSQGTRGLAAADFDQDGDTDLLYGTGQGAVPLLYINGTTPWPVKSPELLESTQFTDVSRESGIGQEQYATLSIWDVSLADFNNDGFTDAFFNNGLTTADPDNPAIPQGQPKQLWIGDGNGTFHLQHGEAGNALNDRLSGRAAVLADFDNDGDIDIYASHNHYVGQLLVNTTHGGNWLGITLEPSTGNRDAIGSTIQMVSAGVTYQTTVSDGTGFLSGNDKRVHIGLGNGSTVDRLTLTWPDHTQTVLNNLPANRYYRISQAKGNAEALEPPVVIDDENPLDFLLNGPAPEMHLMPWINEPIAFTLLGPVLRHALTSNMVSTRRAALNVLDSFHSPQALAMLLTALDDRDLSVRLAALDAISRHEEEYAINHLLRLFASPDPEMRCAVANVFGHFFREEEAVTHHKYLAVPFLIKMLGDPDSTVRICAANALADSEQYRAVASLLSQLNDPDRTVRASVVRALGMIREASASSRLQALLHDPDQPPLVVAQTLVALKRLGMKEDELLTPSILPDPVTQDSIRQAGNILQAMALLTGDLPDAVVFKPDRIAQFAMQWLATNQSFIDNDTSGLLTPLLTSCLAILVETGQQSTESLASHYSLHTNAHVRATAFSLLIRNNRDNRNQYLQNALGDSSPIVRSLVLEGLIRNKIKLPLPLLEPLLIDERTRDLAIHLLSREHSPHANKLKTRLLESDSIDSTTTVLLLDSLIPSNRNDFSLPADLMRNKDIQIRHATLSAWNRLYRGALHTRIPDIIEYALKDTDTDIQEAACRITIERKESWAVKRTQDLFLSGISSRPVRLEILKALAESGTGSAGQLVLRLSNLRHDPLSDDAIAFLGYFTDPALRKVAEAAATDNTVSIRRQLGGISALYRFDLPAAIEILGTLSSTQIASSP